MTIRDGGFSLIPILTLKNKAIEKGKAYCTAIMKDYEEIQGSDDMKVIRDVPNLEAFGATNVVIRKVTEDFWDKVIELTETKGQQYRVCAVGTPGIGKTAATAVLIRKLLLMNRTIVYHVRTTKLTGWVYEFTPTQATAETTFSVKVNVVQEKDFENNTMVSFSYFKEEEDFPPKYYVVDPGETKDDCSPDRTFQGRFILVSSPDEGHWGGNQFGKQKGNSGGLFRIFPLWNLKELLSARQYIKADMSADEVEQRYHQVGGVPGNVFATELGFSGVLMTQTYAINALTKEQLMDIALRGWNVMSAFSRMQHQSAIMGYERSGDDYAQRNVTPISTMVRDTVDTKCQMLIQNASS
jgi:hypothetical protein